VNLRRRAFLGAVGCGGGGRGSVVSVEVAADRGSSTGAHAGSKESEVTIVQFFRCRETSAKVPCLRSSRAMTSAEAS